MKRLLDTFTIWLVVTVRHWLRVAVVALFVLVWIGLMRGDTGDWYTAAHGGCSECLSPKTPRWR